MDHNWLKFFTTKRSWTMQPLKFPFLPQCAALKTEKRRLSISLQWTIISGAGYYSRQYFRLSITSGEYQFYYYGPGFLVQVTTVGNTIYFSMLHKFPSMDHKPWNLPYFWIVFAIKIKKKYVGLVWITETGPDL